LFGDFLHQKHLPADFIYVSDADFDLNWNEWAVSVQNKDFLVTKDRVYKETLLYFRKGINLINFNKLLLRRYFILRYFYEFEDLL
jgi:hypothetical protein